MNFVRCTKYDKEIKGQKKTSTNTILAITIPLVLVFVLFSGLCACFLKKRKSALTKPLLNLSNPEEIINVESLLFNFSVLRVATIDFAEQNKLGEDTEKRHLLDWARSGYISPEYAIHGQFSIKSDVFSYGVLVLEIVTGKKNSSPLENEEIEHLLSFVWDHWTTGTITEVADPFLGQIYPMDEMLKCIQIGLLCVQDNPAHRPTMSNVAVMLSAETMSLETPSKPAYCIERNNIHAGSNFSNGDGIIRGNNDKHLMSRNEVSILDIEPR
ncbi:cysteine-rich RECEPTOR-like kinase [Rhynchospora pubera]|uniref:Cysteine-rich RECEPTOR-like kinase n=1 Tax=Rhynchospora pubera TaxID=906938 RepID=A0AAV8FN67_9POAL|nr:cysteine-rich RECEPTOR-like kinase [Rhynchospora pubera]